ncbi:hypothetical protein ACLESO_52725 [Pyxidicoccus sp. 3LG]
MPEVSEWGDLRRQLEGGLEVVEAAIERYRVLSAALRERRWKAKLRLQPALLEESLLSEPSVLEALALLKKRAERMREETGPARGIARALESARAELGGALEKRLPLDASADLRQRLERLKAVVMRPLPRPPGEGEQLLLEGATVLPPFGVSLLVVSLCAVVARFASLWAALGLLVLTGYVTFLRSGRFWLTSERVLWQPREEDPVEVRLASLGEGQVSLNRFTDNITVGLPGVTLRHVPRAYELAALLSIRRRKEFRSAAATQDRQRPVAILPAYRTKPGEYRGDEVPDGLLVLRPGFIAFFPSLPAARLLDAITEPAGFSPHPSWASRDRVPVSVSQLLDQLLLLPEAEMDAMLRKAASSRLDYVGHIYSPFLLWNPADVECAFGIGTTVELTHDGVLLYWDRLTWQQHQEASRVIALWPRKEVSPAREPEPAPAKR